MQCFPAAKLPVRFSAVFLLLVLWHESIGQSSGALVFAGAGRVQAWGEGTPFIITKDLHNVTAHFLSRRV